MKQEIDKDILFFDGVCNLCNHAVQFILKHEKDHELFFSPLQSPLGLEILTSLPEKADSIILVENGVIYIRSLAALRVAKHLHAPYRWFYYLVIIPPFIRDWIYDLVAKRRYRIFGKKDTCMIPTPALAARFL